MPGVRRLHAHRQTRGSVQGFTRVIVLETDVDVIDTFALPDLADLPADPKDRLFVRAHHYAFETATAVRLRAGTDSANVKSRFRLP